MVAEILELPWLNTARLAQIKLLKGTLERFPLLLELFDYLTQQVLSTVFFHYVAPISLLVIRFFGHLIFEWRVSNRVMSEVKAFAFVNSAAHPLAKVVIVQSPPGGPTTTQILQNLY